MILKILLILAALFDVFWTVKTKKTFPGIITFGMITGILMALFLSPSIQHFGIYLYMVFVALTFIYGLIVKNKTTGSKVVIALMSASIFAYWLWVFNHWHGNTLLLPIFALTIGLTGILSKANLKNELGFLVILAVDGIAIIIESILKTNRQRDC